MTARTISEALFERFCTETSVPFKCLSPDPSIGRRTPDYEVYWQNPPVLVEVKQIDPNRDDNALRRLFADTGEYISRGVTGHRLRGRISKAGSQLRARAKLDQPTLVVVYNNVGVLRGFTDEHAVMAAMYGLYQVDITTSRGLGARVLSVARRLGGGRSMTLKHNTIVSGVAVLFESPKGPYLVVYHNRFAARPLQPDILRHPRIFQRWIREGNGSEFPKWVDLQ